MANRPQTYAAINKLVASLDDPFTRFLVRGKNRRSGGGARNTLLCGSWCGGRSEEHRESTLLILLLARAAFWKSLNYQHSRT